MIVSLTPTLSRGGEMWSALRATFIVMVMAIAPPRNKKARIGLYLPLTPALSQREREMSNALRTGSTVRM